ncbi:S-layer homology domain-containing protein [Subtercola endophyticus]|uniref:S-layer homology domain-containing protein n=1 Tax=Subtercola endophyticus TaxID=2895559 RepID=UPI001E576164|nr:S-layer homology domain-containing protein [Subtercola endophyticus]UFS57732.1 S-layer homology domain-containing protein [Subtercola endophyticus]
MSSSTRSWRKHLGRLSLVAVVAMALSCGVSAAEAETQPAVASVVTDAAALTLPVGRGSDGAPLSSARHGADSVIPPLSGGPAAPAPGAMSTQNEPISSFSGYVVDSGPGNPGLANVRVVVYDSNFAYINSTITDNFGHYYIGGLDTGPYTLWASSLDAKAGYGNVWLNGQSSAASAQFDYLQYNEQVGWNITLTKHTGTYISGSLTSALSHAAQADVYVAAFDADGHPAGYTFSDQNGNWQILGLRAGPKTILFSPSAASGLGSTWWKGSQTAAHATVVTVPASLAGTALPGSVSLLPVAHVSGTVRDDSGNPLAGISSYAWDDDGAVVEAVTDSNGRYDFALSQGSYRFDYYDTTGSNYGYQWWNNAVFSADATVVAVTSPSTPTVQNITLTRGGRVIGRLAIGDAAANLQHPDMKVTIARQTPNGFVDYAEPNVGVNGVFSLLNIPPGTYRLTASDGSNFPGVWPMVWDDGDGTGTIQVSAGSTAQVYFQLSETGFADISIDHTFAKPIAWMKSSGISTGYYSDGVATYRPTEDVQRQAMAAFLYRFARGDTSGWIPPSTASFADVPAGSTFWRETEWMKAMGITTGSVDPSTGKLIFDPTAPVTRQAMAAFLARYAHASTTTPATPSFTDVDASNPFYAQIEWMHATGLTTGYDNGDGTFSFHPDEAVSRQAMAAFLYRYAQQHGAA